MNLILDLTLLFDIPEFQTALEVTSGDSLEICSIVRWILPTLGTLYAGCACRDLPDFALDAAGAPFDLCPVF